MSAYAKTLIAFALGLLLVILGFVVEDETLRQIGYGALAASPLVYAVPNSSVPKS